jgi:outer membrane lipoprotein-sorting protein
MWVYNPAVNQVWQGAVKSWVDASAVPQGLVPLAGYMGDLQKRFDLSLKEGPAGAVTLVAQPKDPSTGYSLELVVSTDKWIPFRTTYRSDSATVVTKLSDITFNPGPGADKFTFTAPKGTDVIPLQ